MIAKILYRDGVEGPVNYVLKNKSAQVLGYGNFLETGDNDTERFTATLAHLGYRNDSEKRFSHIMINLPVGEKLPAKSFMQMSADYMNEMGYGEQPYMVVMHQDKDHQHVHIISSTITEDNTQINLWEDRKRNLAVQHKLEKAYGLSRSPEHYSTSESKSVSKAYLPEKLDQSGLRFYIRDNVIRILKKYKPRHDGDLRVLLSEQGISYRNFTTKSGRVGVSFQLIENNEERFRKLSGSDLDKSLTGPKLQAIFAKNKAQAIAKKDRMVVIGAMAKMGDMFKEIDLKQIDLLSRTLIGQQSFVSENSKGEKGFIAIGKAGYLHRFSESGHDLAKSLLLKSGSTHRVDVHSKALWSFVKRLAKGHMVDKGKVLSGDKVVERLFNDDAFKLIYSSVDKGDLKTFNSALENAVGLAMTELSKAQSKQASETLSFRVNLLKSLTDKGLFTGRINGAVLQSFGLIGQKDKLYLLGQMDKGIALPKGWQISGGASYAAPPYMASLQSATQKAFSEGRGLPKTAVFLPLSYPEFYNGLSDKGKKSFDAAATTAYGERLSDVIVARNLNKEAAVSFLRSRGFLVGVSTTGKAQMISIHSRYNQRVPMGKKLEKTLGGEVLKGQVLRDSKGAKLASGATLENLLTAHHIDSGNYGAAAYRIEHMNHPPTMEAKELDLHMQQGLSRARAAARMDKDAKGKYVRASYSLGSGKGKGRKDYNAFKDELTDYSKKANKKTIGLI